MEGNGLTNSLIRVEWKEGEKEGLNEARHSFFLSRGEGDSTRLYLRCLKYLLISLAPGLIEFFWRTRGTENFGTSRLCRDAHGEQSTYANCCLDLPVCVVSKLWTSAAQYGGLSSSGWIFRSSGREACHCREPRILWGSSVPRHRSHRCQIPESPRSSISGVLDP